MKRVQNYRVAYGDIKKIAEACGCSPRTVRLALAGVQNGPKAKEVIKVALRDFVVYKN